MSQDPPALSIGTCRDYNRPEDLAGLTQYSSKKRYLTSCYLDVCTFSSGMLSRRYEPELTYGKKSITLLCKH